LKIRAATKALKRGDFRQAEQNLLDAAKVAHGLKSADPHPAALWNVLGALYLDDAKYADAERCFRLALALREQLYLYQGQLAQAEPFFLQSQDLFKRHLQPDHYYSSMQRRPPRPRRQRKPRPSPSPRS